MTPFGDAVGDVEDDPFDFVGVAFFDAAGDVGDKPFDFVGVAFFDPRTGEQLDQLLARSDAAMYSVKKRSKGGFEMAPPPGASLDDQD